MAAIIMQWNYLNVSHRPLYKQTYPGCMLACRMILVSEVQLVSPPLNAQLSPSVAPPQTPDEDTSPPALNSSSPDRISHVAG